MTCVIVKDRGDGSRLYWGETGLGLDWLTTPDNVWIYNTRAQAETVFKAVKLGKQRAKIIPYREIKQ